MTTTMRQSALTAATSLLVMAFLSPVAYFYILPRLIDRENVAQTVVNITSHQGLFLAGIACFVLTFIADILAAWALYVFLRPANAGLSLLTGWLRLVYAAMALVNVLKLVTVLRLVRVPDYQAAFGTPQLNAQVQLLLSSFRWEWGFGMIVFAVYLGFLSVLVYRSGYVPKLLGVLLAINSLGYLADSLRPYLSPSTSLPYLFVAFFGELIFMLWLFIWGARIQVVPKPPSVPEP